MLAGALGASLALYPGLPERVPTHWNLQGDVDGWGGKAWGAFYGPAGIFFALLLLLGGEWLSPARFKIEPFRKTYNYIMAIVAALMVFLQVVTLTGALHPQRSYGRLLVGGFFVLFALLANLLGKVRPNFFVGIRVPWTLASERVWVATHRLAARVLTGASILAAVCVWLGVPLTLCFCLLMVGLMIPVVYSFVIGKRLEKSGV
jgi:uncharacterized membrane protein